MIQITRKKGRLEINLLAFHMGKDTCIVLTGGDTPHLGAVTVGSHTEIPKTVTFEHHKENIITEMFSSILTKEYEGNFAICCGIHLDNITRQEIMDSIDLCKEMAEELSSLLKS